MKICLLALPAFLFLAGCSQPQSQADAANAAACTANANEAYQNSTLNLQARTLQNGLRYAGPNEAFNAERLGAQNNRTQQIQNCVNLGNQNGSPTVNGVPVVTPHIVN